jgi:hypothetical protein
MGGYAGCFLSAHFALRLRVETLKLLTAKGAKNFRRVRKERGTF